MRLKVLLVIIVLIPLTFIKAQVTHVVYEFLKDQNSKLDEHLFYDGKEKIVIRDSVNQAKSTNSEDGNTDFVMIGPIYKKIFLQKTNSNTIFQTEHINGEKHIVEDQFPGIDWNTNYTETEVIGNYTCHKATSKYRGSNIVAYYTNDIPISSGPDKFGGLPGLIVLLYNDSAYPSYWTLKQVDYPFKGNLPLDKNKIMALPKMSLKEFVVKMDKETDEQLKVFISKMPSDPNVTVEPTSERGGVEQKYEWEK